MAVKILPMPLLKDSVVNNFWAKIALTANQDKCWNWTAKKDNGYGRFWVNGITYKAVRIVYFIIKKTDPKEKIILHTCDNRACCNPNHLRLGTFEDNSKDMISKGRGKMQFKNGEDHPKSKLTEDVVRDIRNKYATGTYKMKELSLMYNTSEISRIVNRKRWGHIN